jgi:hypothetical protein
MAKQGAVEEAFVELLTVIKFQTEQLAALMAETSAIRDSIRALDPTFEDTFAERRRQAYQKMLPLLAKPIDYIDGLTRRIQAGEIF